jgi:5-methylcytosine-specific restriction endonuclease McrA
MKCPICDKEFTRVRKTSKFCSIECSGVNLSKMKKGTCWTEARRIAESFIDRRKYRPVVRGRREYHPDWNVIRKEVYERDNWECQECHIHCRGNTTKDIIQCHHIDYDIENIDKDNLITLCKSCHSKTNFSRDDWRERFQSIERIEA